ncbi:MAG: ester cyclase [Dehalococcoidales bacterium]|jgi:steroid delta-isomerase-like uncharacterized protein
MVTDAEKMMKNYTAAWNLHDVNKILSFFTDDCIYEDVALGLVNHGKKELTDFINRITLAYPDFKFEVKSVFQAGDWLADEWVMTGTWAHSSNPKMPATGKKFSIRGASVQELRNGKIRRNSDYWDRVTFRQQVGLVPATSK